MTVDAALARAAHRTLEPLHASGYFLPESAQHFAAAGVKGGMRGYVASRSAPLGRVPAAVVVATFYNFAPDVIAAAIPSVWETTTPEQITAARYAAIDEAWLRVLGADALGSAEMVEAAQLAREAAAALDVVGRPLYAGHAALPWPEPPHLQLFHAQTLLREHRGDAHIAALVLAGLDAVEALVSYLPMGTGLSEELLRVTRGWSEADFDAARARLRERGLLDAESRYTAAGQAQRDEIEAATDAASLAGWRALGATRTDRLRELARPWSKALSTAAFGG